MTGIEGAPQPPHMQASLRGEHGLERAVAVGVRERAPNSTAVRIVGCRGRAGVFEAKLQATVFARRMQVPRTTIPRRRWHVGRHRSLAAGRMRNGSSIIRSPTATGGRARRWANLLF